MLINRVFQNIPDKFPIREIICKLYVINQNVINTINTYNNRHFPIITQNTYLFYNLYYVK
ncbi:hypothetical protein AEQU3_01230 [Aequorivita antarctica]|nr:hypothetical protein AEQU3_01230 [Aequorivita antarctica]